MNDLMLHERTFSDTAYLALEIGVERETWLRLFCVCDRNWGNVGCVDLRDLAVRLWPEAARAVLDGDDGAREILRAAVRGIEHCAELSLLIVEETRDGIAVGYRSWEEYTGKWRRSRGAPTEPMGPKLALLRDWSKLGPRSLDAALSWAGRLGVVIPELTTPPVQSSAKTSTAGVESSELSAPNRGRCTGVGVPGAMYRGGCTGNQEPSGVSDADKPPALYDPTKNVNRNGKAPRLTKGASAIMAYVGSDMEKAIRETRNLQEVADAYCGGDRIVLALAYADEAKSRGQPKAYRFMLRDGDPPSEDHVRRAKTGVKYDQEVPNGI